MKLAKLIIIIMLYSGLNAQEFAPIGATWYFSTACQDWTYCPYYTYSVTKDTIIENKSCKYLKYTLFEANDTTENSSFDVILHKNNGVIYNFNNEKFEPLFDFNKSSGDTIISFVDSNLVNEFVIEKPYSGYFKSIVGSTGTTELNGIDHILQHIDPLVDQYYDSICWEFSGGQVLENIGSISSETLFGQSCFQILIDLPGPFFRCYIDRNIEFKGPRWSFPCNSLLTKTSIEESLIKHVKVINAINASEINLLNSGDTPYAFEMYDLFGNLIDSQKNVQALTYIISKTALNKGIYFIKIHQSNRNYFITKILNL